MEIKDRSSEGFPCPSGRPEGLLAMCLWPVSGHLKYLPKEAGIPEGCRHVPAQVWEENRRLAALSLSLIIYIQIMKVQWDLEVSF